MRYTDIVRVYKDKKGLKGQVWQLCLRVGGHLAPAHIIQVA